MKSMLLPSDCLSVVQKAEVAQDPGPIENWAVLQSQQYQEFKGIRCSAVRMTIRYSCSVWNHIHLFSAPDTLHNWEVWVQDCNFVMKTRKLRGLSGEIRAMVGDGYSNLLKFVT